MKVTRIACSASLNAGKHALLEEQARRLGRVRSKVWREYGSVSGAGVTDRTIRDRWMTDGTAGGFGVLANAWKETVRDAAGDVRASRESAKVKVRRAVFRRTADPAERKRLCAALKAEEWAGVPYLSRLMRKHWRRGRSKVANQIVVRADNYRTFALAEGGDVWLAIPGLLPRETVKIPLNTTVAPSGTLRLILRGGKVEVRYQVDGSSLKSSARPPGARSIGVDKGYTEVVTDSDGVHHGPGLGILLSAESDWTKGLTAEALKSVPERRGSALVLVNAAYTSQADPRTGALGVRRGDRLYCPGGDVYQADHAAAINILQRASDPDITLFTPHTRVRQILRERADRQRARLPAPDSSPAARGGERNILTCSGASNE